jgi:hypothetical protein
MAGIDTRDKRASVLGLDGDAWGLEQNPSGTIAQSGRQMAALVYSGILAIAPIVRVPIAIVTLLAGDSRAFALKAATSGTVALLASRADVFTVKGEA